MRMNPHQPLTPQQQHYLQMQQMQQQQQMQQPMMNPAMMHMQQQMHPHQMLQMLMAQGYTHQQAQAMVASQYGNPQQAQMQAMQAVQSRYSSGASGVIPQGAMQVTQQPQQQDLQDTASGRYSSNPNAQTPPRWEPEPKPTEEPEMNKVTHVKDFVVEAGNYAFPNSTKGLKIYTEKLIEETVINHDSLLLTTSTGDLVDTLEALLKESNGAGSKHHIKVAETVIKNDRISIPYKEKLLNIFSRGYRKLQRDMIKISKELDSIDEHVWMRKVSEFYTAKINDYLAVNVKDFIRIDDFVEDISELVLIVSRQYPDVFNNIELYLDTLTDEFFDSIKESNNVEEDKSTKRTISLYQSEVFVYIDMLSYSLGINNLSGYNRVVDDSNNTFLNTLTAKVCRDTGSNEFILVTKDRCFYRFFKTVADEVVVRPVEVELI